MVKLLVVRGFPINKLTDLKTQNVSDDATQMIERGKSNKRRIAFVPNEEL